ncbi:GntR family transcriptional regulator [Sphingopyxis sp. 550A]
MTACWKEALPILPQRTESRRRSAQIMRREPGRNALPRFAHEVRKMAKSSGRSRNSDDNRTTDAWLSEAIIREIIVQRHQPGMPLRENEIAERYEVSRPSAREALRLAAQAGFVEILPWRGARVANIDIDQFIDALGILEDIYARCAALASEHMPESAFAELDRHIPADAAHLPDTADKGQLYRLSFSIGAFIGRHSGSPIAERMLLHIGRLVLWQQRLHLPGTVETEVESLHAHRLMAAAIKSRQRDVAASAARAIVLITRRSLHPAPVRESDRSTLASLESIGQSIRPASAAGTSGKDRE